MAHRDLLRLRLWQVGNDNEERRCKKCVAVCRGVFCADCYWECMAWLYEEDRKVQRFNEGDLFHGKSDLRVELGYRKG